ncbi:MULTISPECIES: response regulator [Kaistia]|uniref:Two-component system response regulator AdeR n=1 Tax=Kaistia defluvii TaxID=410841 RepID=A0ABV2QZH6_9HYPH
MVDKGLILLVEDEPEIAQILDAYLVRDGFRTVRAADGEIALTHHAVLSPDLILLDIRLPKLDGFEVLARIRRESQTPTILVTAMAEDLDRLAGLRLGADDYVVKPFNPQEVVARVNAVLRRTRHGGGTTVLRCEGVEVDLDAHAAFVVTAGDRQSLPLTLSEFRILAYMIRRPMHAFDRADLLDACLPDSGAMARTVDTHIANLRRKLEDLGAPGFFAAVRGVGYRFMDPR